MHDRLTSSVLAGELEEPLTNCVLRQRTIGTPVVYRGPGLLAQEADRSIRLRIFAPGVEFKEAFRREFDRELTPGELVPDSEYYDFEGTDSHGRLWRAERVHVGVRFGSLAYVRANPKVLDRTVESPISSGRPSVQAFLPGKLDLPWHELISKGERGQSLARFEKRADHTYWRVDQIEGGVWLSFSCEDSPIEPRFEAFLRGLSVLTGAWLRPVLLELQEAGRRTTRLINRRKEPSTERLRPPIPTARDYADDAHRFLQRFLAKAAEDAPNVDGTCGWIFQYWNRISRAHESDIENSSLVLSVSVEGLIKRTLLSDLGGDPDFIAEAEEARRTLKRIELGPRARECVLSSLGNAVKPKPQDVLRRLVKDHAITQTHFKAWQDLRHAAAHGASVDYDDFALQQHVDRFYKCLDLYYRLVFQLIGYEGRHRDYGSKGWPTSEFRRGGEVPARLT